MQRDVTVASEMAGCYPTNDQATCAASSPRMLGLPEVDKESAKVLEMKELRQLVESNTATEARHWLRHLR